MIILTVLGCYTFLANLILLPFEIPLRVHFLLQKYLAMYTSSHTEILQISTTYLHILIVQIRYSYVTKLKANKNILMVLLLKY